MSIRKSLALGWVASACLAACGSNSTIGRPSGTYGTWGAQEATAVAEEFLPAIAKLLARPDDEGLQQLLTFSAGGLLEDTDHEGTPSFDLGCGKMVDGVKTDSDSDGVPKKMVAEYSCADASGTHYAGRASVYDPDDENVFGGYGFVFNGYTVARDGVGFTVEGSAELKRRATGDFDFASALTFSSFAPAGRKDWGVFLANHWQPTDVTRPEVAGTLDHLEGYLVLRTDGQAHAVEVWGVDLRYAAQCTGRPESGEIHLRGQNGSELVQSFAACEISATKFADAPL